jgi:hypothetical protein
MRGRRVTCLHIRIIQRFASVAVRENCQKGTPKRRASSPPTHAASSVGSMVVMPATSWIAAIVASGECPAIAPVSPRQKSAYSFASTSMIVAPKARSR